MGLKCWVNAVTSTTPNPYQFFFVVPRVTVVIRFIVESPVPPATLWSVVMTTVVYMMMVMIIIERFPELLPGQCLGRRNKPN